MCKVKKYFRIAFCLLMCLLMLASCGGDGENSTADNSVSVDPGTDNSENNGNNNSDAPNSDVSVPDSGNGESSIPSGENSNNSSDNGDNNSTPSENSQNGNETEAEYSVTAIDGNGDPIANLIVQIKGDDYSGMKTTSAKGVAKFTAKKGEYTITFVSPAKDYYYDTKQCVLTDSVTSITVALLEKAKVTGSVNAYSPKLDDYKEFDAYQISEGMMYAPVSGGEMTYFIFVPTRSGMFEISATGSTEVELGYYGMPIFVHQNSLFEIVDNKFELEIHNYHIGTTVETTSTYVIGVKTADGKDGDCVLTVKRTGDAPWNVQDEPWQVAVANDKYLVKYDGESRKTLKDIDILSNPQIVLNTNDGYYHYGSENGPLVLVRIDSEAKYLGASFVDVCSTSTLGIYVYNDDGSFAYKERYNELIEQYQAICDSNGVCPLNPQLAEMIKDVGEYKGWWKAPQAPGYIFGSDPAYKYPDVAWLFCCCYYE